MESTQLALLTLLTPLVSATVIALFLRRAGALASYLSTAAAGVIAVTGVMLAYGGHRFEVSHEWFAFGDFSLSLGIKFDDLAALMLAMVGVVGFCIHVFSLGYMHDDQAKARFFGGLSIFMFSMLGIVLADNLFMMFVFWELVGFSSYLLINHYCHKQSAADASKKAFIVNRIGDFGFLIGILMCYYAFGTVNLSEIATEVAGGAMLSAAIPLLLFCGALGKSAQMPLHVWLPDAMEGPTPVSALIHAATMVAAGIYMLCRIEVLMVADALNVIMWIGTITALYAALCAIVQSDIKKVLAYSTLSQLGYMVAAFGLGSLVVEHDGHEMMIAAGVGAAMFHLITHACFKALLFLGSGSVIHGCHHEQNIFKMGGLAKKMKITFVTMTIGVLAIVGMPFFSGFYSKDAILHLAQAKSPNVFGVLVFTAVLTSFYMVRMWWITFFGEARSEESKTAHESGLAMTVPLIVLAVLAIVAGQTHGPLSPYGHHFDGVWSQIPHAEGISVYVMSLAILGIGAGLAFALYKPSASDGLATKSPALFTGLTAVKESFDVAYNYYVTKIQDRFAMLLNFLEQILLAGLIVRGLAGFVGLFGIGARALHVGSLHAYVYWFLLGVIMLWGFAGGLF
ncbi:NADH-quinone oxidoreductase subunit L [Synoicihabitans lomoniglobus]|uniref:NADH-quinone oxidoreductase subunit L n=1 Tax=Synoicihabitans lomoniglobus TaxID=2909285 RepID=A0AAE9ZXJ2_9BACT|nr:NADH-quinone oxidoreductase subunit L [Opitutaceae bacterium LMO-M01]WED64949.1 NADH-quinone oxidoreductase subunit L [Opitutaceae bacterium LMO-M01]